jgi:lysozyme
MNNRAKLTAAIGAGAAALLVPAVMFFEGYRPLVYADPIGRLAVCYGHDDQSLTPGAAYSKSECDEILAADLVKHAQALDCIAPPAREQLTDGQKAAFVSFAFNVGVGAFCASTLARKASAGDLPGACAELSKWTFAGGKQLPGLIKRRAQERAMCEGRAP